MSEAEYMRLYDVLDGHVDAAIGCFYTDVVLNGYAADNRSVFAFLNRNAAFWNLHRYSLQSTCFMILGRIFDTASDAHSIHALLAATIQHPEFFSKEALRQRKISLVHRDRLMSRPDGGVNGVRLRWFDGMTPRRSEAEPASRA